MGCGFVGIGAQADALVLPERIEHVRHAEAVAFVARIRRVVDAGEVDEILEPVVLECLRDFDEVVPVDDEGDLAGEFLRVEDRFAEAFDSRCDERVVSDLVGAPTGGLGCRSRSRSMSDIFFGHG